MYQAAEAASNGGSKIGFLTDAIPQVSEIPLDQLGTDYRSESGSSSRPRLKSSLRLSRPGILEADALKGHHDVHTRVRDTIE